MTSVGSPSLHEQLAAQRILPVLRNHSWRDAVDTGRALQGAGARVVELTTSIPQVERAARVLTNGGLTVGVGTIRNTEVLPGMADSGATFAVSYFLPNGFVEECQRLGLVPIPGAQSPTEIQTAADAGATIVKIFPAWLSSPRIIADLAPLVQGMSFLATAFTSEDAMSDWLRSGALAVGVGRSVGTVAVDGAEHVAKAFERLMFSVMS